MSFLLGVVAGFLAHKYRTEIIAKARSLLKI